MRFKLLGILAAGLLSQCLAEPIRLTDSDLAGSKQPQIAVNAEGTAFVTFGKGNAVYFSKSSDEGRTFSAPHKVGEAQQLALGMRRGPRIAAGKDSLTITAISHKDGNLYAWTSLDKGESWSTAHTINAILTSAREGMHGLANDGKSGLFAVWLDLRNKKTELWGARSTDGGKTWEENTRIYKSPDETICECCHPSAAFTSTGEIIVMWRNWLNGSRDIYQTSCKDGGRTFSEARKVGTGTWPLKGCPMDGGDVASNGKQTAYAWRRNQQLFFTSDPNAETLLSRSGTQPIVVPLERGFAFSWQNNGNIYWKSNAQAEPELLAEKAGYIDAVWSAPHKKALAVWEGSDGIYFSNLPR
ncbi:MAG: sialidase family protein [Verrucomicrobiales bacterium]